MTGQVSCPPLTPPLIFHILGEQLSQMGLRLLSPAGSRMAAGQETTTLSVTTIIRGGMGIRVKRNSNGRLCFPKMAAPI